MKVLLAHDYYRSGAPSGEDIVFRNEQALLDSNGVEVIRYECFNDDINVSTLGDRLRVALEGAWSKRTYRHFFELIRRKRPDVAHFHNTFPLISPSAYAACRDNGVPVIQTLHNYRLICASAILQRDGHPCEDCVGTSLMPALWHRCYRNSLMATGALVWMLYRNRSRGSYQNLVNQYIALTHFAAGRLIAGGLPKERIAVKPNFLPDAPEAGRGDGGYAVYVGRLSEEKGVRNLLAAWKYVSGQTLKILGDGPLRGELEKQSRQYSLSVEFLGMRTRQEVMDIVGRAELQIIPSESYEGFPMVVLEAYACGTPVVAARIGSLEEIVEDGKTGLLFEARNALDLAEKVKNIRSDRERLGALRQGARACFEKNYTADHNYAILTKLYNDVIDNFKGSVNS